MLWLPRGIWAWYQAKAVEKETTLGSLLIENACNWAWENGYSCMHPTWAIKLVRPGQAASTSTSGTPYTYKCTLCGKELESNVRLL